MDLKINPFNKSNPMSLKDAGLVSAIGATTTYVLTFLANATLGQIRADVAAFVFDSVKVWLATFFGNLITLTGIKALVEKVSQE